MPTTELPVVKQFAFNASEVHSDTATTEERMLLPSLDATKNVTAADSMAHNFKEIELHYLLPRLKLQPQPPESSREQHKSPQPCNCIE